MDLNSKNIKKILLIISFAILLFLGLQNFGLVCDFLVAIYRLLSPFIIGLCLAFILNVLLKLLEEKVFARLNRKNNRTWNRCRRGVCLSLTVLIVLGLLFVLVFMIVPELQKSFGMLIDNIPYYTQSVQKWTDGLLSSLNISQEIFEDIRVDWDKLLGMVGDFLKNFSGNFLSKTVDITTSIFSGIVNFVLGIVFSIYMLMHKEKLCGQAKRIAFAFLPQKHADYLISVGKLSNKMFSRFVAGQLTEAVIIGMLCFLGMSIFSMPYAPLISTIVGCTALIPIFGAFIGTAVGAFVLLMVKPITAFWFIVFIIVLQQLEGNIIYPRVVGSSIGLPGIWVLFTVTVCGGIFGIMGMLVGIPLISIAYCLFRNTVAARLKEKKITHKEIEQAGEDLTMR